MEKKQKYFYKDLIINQYSKISYLITYFSKNNFKFSKYPLKFLSYHYYLSEVNLIFNKFIKIGVNIRPFWKECLQEISKNYLIIVFTASHKSYADSVLDYLDPKKELIKFRLYRNHCIKVNVENDGEETLNENKLDNQYIYIKDLRVIKNVKPKNMVIIDNSVLSFSFDLDNGIPILPFYDNSQDNELMFLKNYLIKISAFPDIRIINRHALKLNYFLLNCKDGPIDLKSYNILSESEENYKITKKNKKENSEEDLLNSNLISKNEFNNNTDSYNNFIKEVCIKKKESQTNMTFFPNCISNDHIENDESEMSYISNCTLNNSIENILLNITNLESKFNIEKNANNWNLLNEI